MEIQKCPECGSTDLSWNVGVCREIPIFYAGCNYCSETLSTISLEAAADLLTKYAKGEAGAGK